MLDDDAYLHWLNQCGFSDPARTLLTDIRRSPPVHSTTGGRGNIHGQYPSRKMRRTIQFESHTELGAIYLMELDTLDSCHRRASVVIGPLSLIPLPVSCWRKLSTRITVTPVSEKRLPFIKAMCGPARSVVLLPSPYALFIDISRR
jgi:hypothetical protein